jgi:TRAP transporter 4TM/12TM fusion protein
MCILILRSDSEVDTQKIENMPLRMKLAKAIAVIGILYHFYVLVISPVAPGILRPIHLLFAVLISVLTSTEADYKRSGKLFKAIEYLLAIGVLISTIYVIVDQENYIIRCGVGPNTADLVFSVISIAAILLLTKRNFGWPLVILTGIFFVYAFFGNYAPGLFKIRPMNYTRIIGQLYSVENGIFGMMTGVSAVYVLPFLFLGAMMGITGTGELFIDLANSLTGRRRGGPAKVAVVSSALFGTMSGAGSANVVATGTFTIPTMIRTGYPPVFAGAVEAVASTGGQIMPPIMASAAFLAAEITGIPYGRLALAAVVPALIYYLAVYTAVDLKAGQLKLRTLKEGETKPLSELLLKQGVLLIPLLIIILMMMIMNASPLRAASFAILSSIIIALFRKENRITLGKFIDAVYDAAHGMAPIAVAFVAAGISVGLINLSGFGIRMSSVLMNLSEGNLILALILTAVITIALGMGLPVAASYVITASVCAPVLVKMGIPLLPAHLFVLHFASLSSITPPVALAAYAAAGIAKENPLNVGIQSVKLGLASFLLPFMFVFGPEMLITHDMSIASVPVIIFAILGTFAITFSTVGWFRENIALLNRVLLIIGGVLMLYTDIKTSILGIALAGIALFIHYSKHKESFRKPKDKAVSEG